MKGLDCDRRGLKDNAEVVLKLNMAYYVFIFEQMDLYCMLGVVQLDCHWLNAKCVATQLGRCFDDR